MEQLLSFFEEYSFLIKLLGSIFLIYQVILLLAEILDDGWDKFVLKYKRKLNGSERKEKREAAKKKAIEQKNIQEKEKAHKQMIEDAGGWEKFIEPLKNEYEKERAELSIQKKIKCDDGVIRIYEESMRGIISVSDSDASFFIYKTISSGHTDLIINREKWFSKEGKTLNREEIISNNNYKRQHNDIFQKKYKEIIKEEQRQNSSRVKFSRTKMNHHNHSNKIICINDILFYSDITPFSGEIKFKKKSEYITITEGYILNSKGEKKTINEIKLDFFTVKNIDSEVIYKFYECNNIRFTDITSESDSYQDKLRHFYFYFDKIQDSLQ